MKNTGIICMVSVNTDDGARLVDMGNYFEHHGQRVLVTSEELAVRYGHLIGVPIYVLKLQERKRGKSWLLYLH